MHNILIVLAPGEPPARTLIHKFNHNQTQQNTNYGHISLDLL